MFYFENLPENHGIVTGGSKNDIIWIGVYEEMLKYKVRIANFDIDVEYANTRLKRRIGLIGRKKLKNNAALLIVKCAGIHTRHMRFNIDAIFLNEENMVVKIIEGMPPWQSSGYIKGAYKVLEFSEGTILKLGIEEGSIIDIPRVEK